MTSSEDLAYAMSAGAYRFSEETFDKLELSARVRNIQLLAETMKALKAKNDSLENQNLFIKSLIESIPHPLPTVRLKEFCSCATSFMLNYWALKSMNYWVNRCTVPVE